MESLIPYLNQNASLKNIDVYTDFGSDERSVLENNTISMFQQIEFENHIDNYLWVVDFYLDSLSKLEILIEQIITEIRNNITTKGLQKNDNNAPQRIPLRTSTSTD
jgi:hypothetical protein